MKPWASQDDLRAVERWLKINGEAVYGAGPKGYQLEIALPEKAPGEFASVLVLETGTTK